MAFHHRRVASDAGSDGLSNADYAIGGFMSGFGTRLVSQPFDVVKIRLQLQHESIHPAKLGKVLHVSKPPVGKYHWPIEAMRTIAREEGLHSLWKGTGAGQVLSVLYSSSAFYSFELMRNYIKVNYPNLRRDKTHRAGIDFVCGFVSGKISSICSYPFDIIRTRMCAQGEPKVYHNTFHAFQCIYKADGIRGFYRGAFPALLTYGPQTGLQFAFYHFLINASDFDPEDDNVSSGQVGAIHSATCGLLSGMTAKILVFPVDLFKKRLQVVGFEEARWMFGTTRSYTGLVHLVRSISKYERLPGFYKGLWASILKSGISTSCTFLFYEQACKLIRKVRNM